MKKKHTDKQQHKKSPMQMQNFAKIYRGPEERRTTKTAELTDHHSYHSPALAKGRQEGTRKPCTNRTERKKFR